MNVILGKDVHMEITKEGDYKKYICAENIEIRFQMETKAVRTIGDGYAKKYRGQAVGYTVNVTSLIPYDEPGEVNAFDLIEYWRQMVDVSFRILFKKQDGTGYTQIRGNGLVTDLGITGPADFAGSELSIQGNGIPEIGEPPTCSITIFNFDFPHQGGFIYEARVLGEYSGPAIKYDWRLDGGAVDTALSTGWFVNVAGPGAIGDHVLEVWPVCANGVQGNKYVHNFTVI